MGAVLDARDQKLGRSVAMKVMLRRQASEEEEQRFLQEARVLGQLAHPNIVPVYDLGRDEQGRFFYTMKLVQGVTLHEIISKLKSGDKDTLAKYPLNALLNIFQKVCDAVAFAHSRGIIHRDLKPQNIMVGEFGEVLVMDWGLAKILPGSPAALEAARAEPGHLSGGTSVALHLPPPVSQAGMPPAGGLDPAEAVTLPLGARPAGEDAAPPRAPASMPPDAAGLASQAGTPTSSYVTLEGAVMGTPNYMSPEQAEGRVTEVDARSDLFSLGGILYALLTLRPPVEGDSPDEILTKVRSGTIAPPTTFNAPGSTARAGGRPPGGVVAARKNPLPHCPDGKVPAALSAVTMKALARDKTRRYQTVAEFSADIAAYQGGFATSAENATALTLLRLFIHRHKVLTAAASIIVVLTIGFITKVVSSERKAEANARTAQENEAQARANAKAAEENAKQARAAEGVAREKSEAARQALARSQTSLAEAAYREFDSPAMLATLEGVPEDLRDSDWRYLRARAENSQTVFTSPTGNYSVGVAAHPKKPGVFAGALMGNTFVFVDALSGQRVFEFPGTEKQRAAGWCRSVDFLPDGTRMIAGALNNGGVVVYDTATGRPLVEWATTGKDVEWVRFSPDGTKALDLTSALELTVRDATNGKPLWSAKSVGRAVFSPKGEVIVPSGRSIRVHDGTTGALIKTLPELRDSATHPALSPDGTVLYLGCSDGVVRGQRLADGAVTFEQRLTDSRQTVRVALSADGRRLLGAAGLPGGRRMSRVWDTATGITLQMLMGGTGGIEGVAMHPLTDEAIISGPDTRTWALATREVESKTLGSSVAAVFWGAEDVFIARDKPARFGADGRWSDLPLSLPEECRGGSVAAAAGEIAVFGKYVGSGSPVAIFRKDADGFTLLHTVRTKRTLARLRVSPGGRRIVTVDPYVTTEVFDTATGQRVCECDGKVVLSVLMLDWLGADRIVAIGTRSHRGAASAEEHVFVWDAATGKVLRDVRNSANADVLAVAPDGRTFAEGGENKRVRIRDAETLEVLRELRAHDGAITALAFHPTQPVLATGSADLSVRLWSLDDLSLIEEARPSVTDPVKLSFSPRGTRLASTDRGNGVSFLNLAEPPLGKFTRRSSTNASVEVTDLSALRKVASDHARAGRFPEAKTAFAALLKAGSDSSIDWFQLAAVLAQLGDDVAYRAHCHEFLARVTNTTSADAMERAGKVCLLLPIDDTDRAIALQLARKAIATAPQGLGTNYYRAADGFAHYRSGDFAKALEVLTPLAGSSSAYVSTYAGAVLALAQHQLGQTAEARARLDRADAIAAAAFPPPGADLGVFWQDVLLSRLLLKEARATIAPGTQPPPPPPLLMAQVHARAGRWAEARAAFTAAVKERPENYYSHMQLAIVLAHLGDRTAHRQLAHEMVASFGGSTNLTALSCTAKASVLFSGEGMDTGDRTAVIRIADTLTDGGAKSPFYEFDASLARYRTGDYSNAAAPILQRGEAYAPYVAPGARALLALAQHRLGQTAEARVTLARAETLADEKLPKPGADLGIGWHDVLVSQMLLREARETIGK